jgi:uncharacterized membrane protein
MMSEKLTNFILIFPLIFIYDRSGYNRELTYTLKDGRKQLTYSYEGSESKSYDKYQGILAVILMIGITFFITGLIRPLPSPPNIIFYQDLSLYGGLFLIIISIIGLVYLKFYWKK